MHHFVYPSQDTFITDTPTLDTLNFGLDEILRVGTKITTLEVTEPTTTFPFSGSVSSLCVSNFSGSVSGSLFGTGSAVGLFVGETAINNAFTFTGDITGSWVSASATSSFNVTQSLVGFSGSLNGFINGTLSGSFETAFTDTFIGSLVDFTGKFIVAAVSGSSTLNLQRQFTTESIFRNRALVQFDISAIAAASASGDIQNPRFVLKMNVAREEQLPISYSIYVSAISESWVMGNGYLSDNGSDQGASWIYKDYKYGTTWSVAGGSTVGPTVSQSFTYQVGDISVDVTPIVTQMISGTIPNNGFLVESSDEVGASKTGMALYFFSRDTNTIYSPRLDVSWNDFSWTTGSVFTASQYSFTSSAGLLGFIADSASVSGTWMGGFSGVTTLHTDFGVWNDIGQLFESWSLGWDTASFPTAWGFMDVTGQSGQIVGWNIYGDWSGSLSYSIWQTFKTCKMCQPTFSEWWPLQYPDYVNVGSSDTSGPGFSSGPCSCGSPDPWWLAVNAPWWWTSNQQCCFNPSGSVKPHTGGFQWVNINTTPISDAGPCSSASFTGSLVTMSFVMGTLVDGPFSGSIFTSSIVNGYQLNFGIIQGTWTEAMLSGTLVTASYPMGPMYPNNTFVFFSGPYIGGMALGSLTSILHNTASTEYDAVFDGIFVNGPEAGDTIHAPFSGTLATASTETTVYNLGSQSLSPVDVNKPFVTVIQNIPNVVKAGNVIRVNVFARPEFPLKNFKRQTQFEQFLVPQYLPTASYYGIKDNETEEIILDFDNYTQISCDANGNFFMLDTTGLPQERYFRLLIKTEFSGSIYTFDKSDIFKIVR